MSSAARRSRLRSRRARVLAGRAGAGLLTLTALLTLVFLLTNLRSPESIARQQLGEAARTDPTLVPRYIREHDLDGTVVERLVNYMDQLAHGRLGTSSLTGEPVATTVLVPLKRSAILLGISFLIAVPLALSAAAFLALRIDSHVGRAADLFTIVASALPGFVVAVVLSYVFAVRLGWLPVDSGVSISFGDRFVVMRAYVLPILATVAVITPYLIRVGRAVFIDALSAPHVRATVLRGLSRRRVLWRYVVPTTLVIMTQFIFVTFVSLLGAVVVIETVTGFPGVGQLLVQSITNGDAALTQGAVLILGASVIVLSLVADSVSAFFNPLLRSA